MPGLGRAADAAAGLAPRAPTDAQQLLYAVAPAGAVLVLTVNLILGQYKPGRCRAARP